MEWLNLRNIESEEMIDSGGMIEFENLSESTIVEAILLAIFLLFGSQPRKL